MRQALIRGSGESLEIGQVKTERSERTISISRQDVEELRAHRIRPTEERLASTEEYEGHGLVFATRRGTPIAPWNLLKPVSNRPFQRHFPEIAKPPESLTGRGFRLCGAEGDRTLDLMNAIHALSRLSYRPTSKMCI